METEAREVEKEFRLPGGKVIVRLVGRPRGSVMDPNHILYNMAPGATFEYCPRNERGSHTIKCPLNAEEIEFFENKRKSGMAFDEGDLSPYADAKVNFWRSKKAKVVLTDKPREFDLSKAKDYLDFKILLSNDDTFAPSADKEFSKKSYVFVATSEEETQQKTLKTGDIKKRAWKIASKMEDDRQKMIDYLTVVGKRPGDNSKKDFLIAEIDKQVEENVKEFLEILEDPQYDTRVLLTKSLQNKSVMRDGHKYFLAGGDPLCNKGEVNNMASTLNFLDAAENQDIRLTLMSKLK